MTPARRNTTIRLDDDLYQGMQEVWQRDAIQPSEQIRRALREWLEKKGVTHTGKKKRDARLR